MPTVDEHLIFDGKRYSSSTAAARKAGLTNDYIARLSRQGKVRGKVIGKTWYVEEDSLFSFLVEANKRKAKRKHELRAERREEYRVEGEKPLLVAPLLSRLEKPKTKPKAQSDPWTEAALHTARSLQYHSPKRALAFALSLAIVFSVPVFAEAIPQGVRELRQSFVGRAALATAEVLDDSLVGVVFSAEVSAFKEAKEGIVFTGMQLARRLKSDAPAAVLETTSNSDTISFTIRLEELKAVFYKSLSLVKVEIVRLMESLFPQP